MFPIRMCVLLCDQQSPVSTCLSAACYTLFSALYDDISAVNKVFVQMLVTLGPALSSFCTLLYFTDKINGIQAGSKAERLIKQIARGRYDLLSITRRRSDQIGTKPGLKRPKSVLVKSLLCVEPV